MPTERRRRYRRDPIPASARLGRYLGGGGSARGPGGELARVQAAWKGVAGAAAAGSSVVVRVSRAGVVSVACASAMWAQELHTRREVLAEQLRRAVPDLGVAGLRFVVGDHAIPAAEAPRGTAPVRPTADELARAGDAVGDVSDPALRDLLTRAAAGQMAVARRKSKSLQIGKKSGRDGRGG